MLAQSKIDRAHLVVNHRPTVAKCERLPSPVKLPALRAVPAMADAGLLFHLFLSSPTVNLDSVTEVIRRDVGLSIEVLRLASCRSAESDQFGISQSVVHAGVSRLRLLSGQIGLLSAHTRYKPSLRECEQFWVHARLTALMAEEQAYKVDCDPEEAYVAGLLLRIGELPALLGWDWDFIGARPSEIAGVLARTWSLPARLAEILGGDDLQLPSRSRRLLQLVRVADQQAFRIQGLVSEYARCAF